VALENDDRCFTPRDLVPLCERTGVPLVYDIHHHRCLADGYSVGEATNLAFATWRDREPYAHLSSPKDGWAGPNIRAHADYIDPADFPEEWVTRAMTIDVEAKAKERAVLSVKGAVSFRAQREIAYRDNWASVSDVSRADPSLRSG
jgi:UV DNA damage endonuclease